MQLIARTDEFGNLLSVGEHWNCRSFLSPLQRIFLNFAEFRLSLLITFQPAIKKIGITEMVFLRYKHLLNSQPRLLHFSRSDLFTQSRLSADIPWFDLIWQKIKLKLFSPESEISL